MAHGKRHHLRADAGFVHIDGRHGFRPRHFRLDRASNISQCRHTVRKRDFHAH